MKTRFAAIIGMTLILTSAALPVQAAAAENGFAKTGSAAAESFSYADITSEFRYLKNGWYYRSGAWYYVRDGKAATGWLKSGSDWYFMDESGRMKSSCWVKYSGKWYYLGSDGTMRKGWTRVNNKWYFLAKNGEMKTGWVKSGGKWYRLEENGEMKTGWAKVKGLWYYLAPGGEMKTGWVRDSGKWYYLTSAGAMKTGWLKTGGKTYYLTGSGAMQTGWLTIGGKKYYFEPNGTLNEEKTKEAQDAAEAAKVKAAAQKESAQKESAKKEAEQKETAQTVRTKGEMIAAYALQFVGNPYVYGGCSLTNGTDCSGFVMLIYRHFGVELPHYDAAIRTKGKSVDSLSEAKAGDIICYYGHVAIYLGDGRIVHASNSRDGIKISERADYRTIAGIRRIFD